jgi:hypothetical protein
MVTDYGSNILLLLVLTVLWNTENYYKTEATFGCCILLRIYPTGSL